MTNETPAHSFIAVDLARDHEELVSINIEYLSWVHGEIGRTFGLAARAAVTPVADCVASVVDKVCGERPPRGVFYLIDVHGQVAGMCGLRRVRDGVAEIKRLYVRPHHRGMKLGQLALQQLMSDASRFGYRRVCLDSAPFMAAAQRLYEAHGFVDCAAYEGTEVPSVLQGRWRFMQRATP